MASSADVIRYFLPIEASRDRYSGRREEIASWCSLPDDELLKQAAGFARERADTCPILAYTVGTPLASYVDQIASWSEQPIPSCEVYSCGIAERINDDLSLVGWNLCEFARIHAGKYPQFRETLPSPEIRRIVVVKQQKVGKIGAYELIDGAHRFIAMCRNGIETVDAYVGLRN